MLNYNNIIKLLLKNKVINITIILTIAITIMALNLGYSYLLPVIQNQTTKLPQDSFNSVLVLEFFNKFDSREKITLQNKDIDQYRSMFNINKFTPVKKKNIRFITPNFETYQTIMFVIDESFFNIFDSINMSTGNLKNFFETNTFQIFISNDLENKVKSFEPSVSSISINSKKIHLSGTIEKSFFNSITGNINNEYLIISSGDYQKLYSIPTKEIGYDYLIVNLTEEQNIKKMIKIFYDYFDNIITKNQITTQHHAETLKERINSSNVTGFISVVILSIIVFSSIIVGFVNLVNILNANYGLKRKIFAIKKVIGADYKILLKESLIEFLILSFIGGIIGSFSMYLLNQLINELLIDFYIEININISFMLLISLILGVLLGYINSKMIYKDSFKEAMSNW